MTWNDGDLARTRVLADIYIGGGADIEKYARTCGSK